MFEIKSEPVSFLVYLKPQCTGGHLWIKVGQVPSQSATRPLPPAWCKSRHEVRWSPLLQYHLLQQSHKHQEALLRVGKTGNFWQSLYEQKWKPSASQPSCSFEEMHLYCGRQRLTRRGRVMMNITNPEQPGSFLRVFPTIANVTECPQQEDETTNINSILIAVLSILVFVLISILAAVVFFRHKSNRCQWWPAAACCRSATELKVKI